MDTISTIATRYSCRNYTGEQVENEKIEAVALAAVQSPSGMNMQPWQITVVKDKAFIDEMDVATMEMLGKKEDKALYDRITGRGGRIFYNAPCMFVIAKKPGTDLDCGIVSENIALAASAFAASAFAASAFAASAFAASAFAESAFAESAAFSWAARDATASGFSFLGMREGI